MGERCTGRGLDPISILMDKVMLAVLFKGTGGDFNYLCSVGECASQREQGIVLCLEEIE